MAKHAGGRPTVMTKEVIAKLERAYSCNCNDLEAALFADISIDSLKRYQTKYPEFSTRKEELRSRPRMTAKFNVSDKLVDGDSDMSKWVLNHTDPDYKPKSSQDVKLGASKSLLDAIIEQRKAREGKE